jgi:exodeoxyribonuclease-3
MKVSTWNVNGLRARHAELVAWVAAERPDVLCLQEIKCPSALIPEPLTTLSDYWSYWHGAGGYSGVSLHLRRGAFPTTPKLSQPAIDRETRVVEARVGELVFTSMYVPNGGKDYRFKLEFLDMLAEHVASVHRDGKLLVLCGDMNVTRSDRDVHPTQRRPNVIGQRPDERALFERVLARDLVDVVRVLHPDDDRLFTWWPFWQGAREQNLGWRLDYVLTSAALAGRATSAEVRAQTGKSDHAPVVVELVDVLPAAQQGQP